jgi:hypothetical protein
MQFFDEGADRTVNVRMESNTGSSDNEGEICVQDDAKKQMSQQNQLLPLIRIRSIKRIVSAFIWNEPRKHVPRSM